MTIIETLDTLKEYLAEELKEYVVYDKDMQSYPLNFFSGALPRKTSDTTGSSYYPAIMVLSLGGDVGVTESTLGVRVVMVIHDDSVGDGCREIYNLSEKVRRVLTQSTIIGDGIALNFPLKWENSVDTNWPIWQAWFDFTVNIRWENAPLEKWYKKRR